MDEQMKKFLAYPFGVPDDSEEDTDENQNFIKPIKRTQKSRT